MVTPLKKTVSILKLPTLVLVVLVIYSLIFFINYTVKVTARKTQDSLETLVKPLLVTLNAKVPSGEYYKYNDNFRHTIQRLGYLAIFSNYILNGSLCSISDTAKLLGCKIYIKYFFTYKLLLEFLLLMLT